MKNIIINIKYIIKDSINYFKESISYFDISNKKYLSSIDTLMDRNMKHYYGDSPTAEDYNCYVDELVRALLH